MTQARPPIAAGSRLMEIIPVPGYKHSPPTTRGISGGMARRLCRVCRWRWKAGRFPSFRFPSLQAATLLSLGLVFGIIGTCRAATGYYTKDQATAGQAVFDQTCSICHGQHLEGKAGPALSGQQFLSVSQFQKLTAEYLYKFMSKQMPANAPGSLSKAQYLDVLAYILEVNGYPAGSQKLTADDQMLSQIKIEPTGKSQGESYAKEEAQ